MTQIITKTKEEWLEKRSGQVGASEVHTLLYNYKKKETEKAFGSLNLQPPFSDAYCLYHTKVNGYRHEIKKENTNRGKFAEEVLAPLYLKEKMPFLKFKMNPNCIIEINGKYPKLSCTPDGWLEAVEDGNLCDVNGNFIKKEDGPGLIEIKCTNEWTATSNYGIDCPDGYLIQLQDQLLVCDRKWDMLLIFIEVPLTEDNKYDDYFYIKGDIGYKVEFFIYRLYKEIKNLILEANEMFQKDIENYLIPKPIPESKFLDEDIKIQKKIIEEKYETPEFDEEIEVEDEELEYMIEEYEKITEERKMLEKEEKKALFELQEKLLDRKATIINRRKLYWTSSECPSKIIPAFTMTKLRIKKI